MKYSLNWLKEHVAVGIGADALAHKLTMAGLEVEAIHPSASDTIIEIEVTPNRADCLSVEGLAREVAAILNKTRKAPAIGKIRTPQQKCDIAIEDKKDCRRYIGTIIENVAIKSAPDEIQKHLLSLGGRAISNIVDITNFCLIENGQPLHAFDYDKLAGGRIIVRRAKKGEKIRTIDDKEHELDPSVLVIADDKRPVAIAGIMGGKETEVTASTKKILLESAYFDPVLIRRASRKLGLSSDSSYRFERGVDLEGVKRGSERALTLILKAAGGQITHYKDLYLQKAAPARIVPLSVSMINTYLGSAISASRCQTILKKLDFSVKIRSAGKMTVSAPSHRPDIREVVDVIEEIARIEGYDKLPVSLPTIKVSTIQTSEKRLLRENLKRALLAQGFDEIITYSTTNQESLRRSNQHVQGPKITNPLSMDQEMMRPSLLPGMLNVVSFNVNRGQKDLRFFEAGKIYQGEKELETLGIVMVGAQDHDWRRPKTGAIDFYDLKGAVVGTLKRISDGAVEFDSRDVKFLEMPTGAEVRLLHEPIGVLGKIPTSILKNFTIKDAEVWFAQIDLEKVYRYKKSRPTYHPIASYPAITRDISFTFDQTIAYKEIVETIRSGASKNLIEINFKEDYTKIIADKIEPGHRGVLISLMYQSQERTLAEDEVNAEHQAILKRLVDTFKIIIR